MQGLVTIDFGNTRPHAGLFQKNQDSWQLIKVTPFNELTLHLHSLQMTPDNTSLVLCEVKPREEELFPILKQGYLLTRVKDYWKGQKFAGMPVNYAKTLGEDRLIQAFYAFKKLKDPLLLIDAGTFATMDVVTQEGFRGGYILPGLQNYFSSFQKGEQLKEVLLNKEFSHALPQETLEAMRDSYQAYGAMAKDLMEKHKLSKVLLTGGDGEAWKKILSSSLVVQNEPALIHLALHYWMTTQIEPL